MADGINFNLLGVGEPSPYQQAQQRDLQNQLAQQQLASARLQTQAAQQQFEQGKAAAARAETYRAELKRLGVQGDPRALLKHLLTSDDPKVVEHAIAGLQDMDEADAFDRFMGFKPQGAAPAPTSQAIQPQPGEGLATTAPVPNTMPANALVAQTPSENQLPAVVVSSGKYVPTPVVDVTAARIASMKHPGRRAVGEAMLKATEPDKLAKLDILEQRLLDAGVPEDDPRIVNIQKERENLTASSNAEIRAYEYGKKNPGFAAHQLALKKAGAANVSVSTEKKYGEAFGADVAKQDVALRSAAEQAPTLAENANRIAQLVHEGKVFTGTAANIKLQMAKALKVAGGNDSEMIANTETLISALAQNTLGNIKASGLGTGQGFTDKDLKFLESATSGNITFDSATLSRLAGLAHKVAETTAGKWNKRVKEIPSSATAGTGINTEPITVAPRFTGKASAGKAPAGVDQALWEVMTPDEKKLWQPKTK